ncbi:LysR family transcriptional regulator [Enterobacter sp. Ap-1006]|uniref:LysR family transcriptional regulator n=1 Tax=Enterobacter sp. Ap-1006 TaxID=2608345 RepID=UPI001964D077|nr:LysR family transcriptional regulator [Enterobacter sp. Ap-1006]
MNFEWLKTYCTLVETGHFTRTAEKLHMTQPGVSQHIQKLETSLGKSLLVRQGKRFTLTHEGESVFQQGRQILADLNALTLSVRQDDPWRGQCCIASPGSLALKLYPALLGWQGQYPDLQLDYHIGSNDGVERDIAERRLDVALTTRAAVLTTLHSEEIAREELLLVTPANCLTPSWEALCQLGFISHPDGSWNAPRLLQANFPQFDHLDNMPRRGFCNIISTILAPVAKGLGFTVLARHAVEAFSQQDKIRIHRLEQQVFEPVYLVTRRYHPQPLRIQAMIKLIKQTLA